MKAKTILGIGLAGIVLAGCGRDSKEKLKTIYQQPNASVGRAEGTYMVTAKFGELKVRVGETEGESEVKPWSSWWYPLNEKVMFYNEDGGASPLEKYDFYSQKLFSTDSEAALFEERNIYQPTEVAWAGLCHAWAIASVLHPEPSSVKHISGIRWSVADQKALLLKTYEIATGISEIMYGQRFNGDRDDDYDDIYPDQFHKLAQNHLVEQQKPFLMDYDARYPVWTVPVYKVKFFIEKRDEHSAEVSAWVTFASPHVDDLNYVGTKRVVKNYKYILKGDWVNGELHVTEGEWIGGSKEDHPDYLVSYPSSIKRGSRNTEIKAEVVDSILR